MNKTIRFAPIIHSRTYIVDFRDDFIAVPGDFGADKINWAKKFILASTGYMEFLDHGTKRKVVFSDGEHCIIGITVRIKDLCKECGEELEEVKDMFGRPLFAFLGFACKVSELPANQAVEISTPEYLDIFKRNVAIPSKWKEVSASPPEKLEYSGDVKYSLVPISPDSYYNKLLGRSMAYESNNVNDRQVYECAFTVITSGREFSCCTNMANVKAVQKGGFNLSTCSDMGGEGNSIVIEPLDEPEAKKTYANGSSKNEPARAAKPVSGMGEYAKISLPSRNYKVKKAVILGDIIRLTLIAGGILYLITMPLYSIPASIIVGGITVSLSVYEIMKLSKKSDDKKSVNIPAMHTMKGSVPIKMPDRKRTYGNSSPPNKATQEQKGDIFEL